MNTETFILSILAIAFGVTGIVIGVFNLRRINKEEKELEERLKSLQEDFFKKYPHYKQMD